MVQSRAKKTTIKDLVNLTGFSKTTISFAFNNPEKLNKNTLETILNKAKEIGYSPSPMARNLSKQKYNSIGFLLPQKMETCLENPYLMQLIKAIGHICETNNYSLTLIPPSSDFHSAITNAAVDGIISLGINVQDKIKQAIKSRCLPCIIIDGYKSKDIINVGIDNRKAAYDIMKLVLDNKHEKLAIIALSANEDGKFSDIREMRLEGYERALKEKSINISNVKLLISEAKLEGGSSCFREIIKKAPNTTAIVCMSDIIAIGCLKEAERCGVKIPEQLSIVGFDNIQESNLVTPGLTTVDQSPIVIGRKAAELLFELMENKQVEVKDFTFEYHLMIRDSLSKPQKENI